MTKWRALVVWPLINEYHRSLKRPCTNLTFRHGGHSQNLECNTFRDILFTPFLRSFPASYTAFTLINRLPLLGFRLVGKQRQKWRVKWQALSALLWTGLIIDQSIIFHQDKNKWAGHGNYVFDHQTDFLIVPNILWLVSGATVNVAPSTPPPPPPHPGDVRWREGRKIAVKRICMEGPKNNHIHSFETLFIQLKIILFRYEYVSHQQFYKIIKIFCLHMIQLN